MIKPVEPEVETLGQFLNAFNGESDRGAALTAAARNDRSSVSTAGRLVSRKRGKEPGPARCLPALPATQKCRR